MPDFPIRPCEAGDLPAVLGLMEQLAAISHGATGFELPHFREVYDDMARRPEIYLNAVAVAGDRVIGFISLIFYRTFFHQVGTALINELVVDQQRRGTGVGGALVEWARAEAVARGMDELEVCTERENVAALRFYRRHGFDGEYVLLGMEFDPEA